MRRIIINGDYLALKTFAGVSRFAEETVKEIDKMLEDINNIEIVILTPKYATREAKYKNIKVKKSGALSINIWRNITLPRYVHKMKAILLDFTQAFPMGIKSITYIHDCIPDIYPNAYETKIKRLIRRPIKLLQRKIAAKNCLKLMTLTENSKKDIEKYYKIPSDKIVVSYTGWEHIIKTEMDDSIFKKIEGVKANNYCFTLGSRVWHKNLKWVLEAAMQNPQYKFVVSGENSYFTEGKKIKENLIENVIFTGYISDGQVRALMANCKAFLFPTLYEGFGMPPLEALSTGTQIIISNTSCLPEIYEGVAHYINPLEYDGISIDYILDEEVNEPDAVLSKYSWKKTANTVLNTINECLNEG